MPWTNHASSTSVTLGAAVTNPTAGSTLVNIPAASLPQGMWAVQLVGGLAGTVTTADSANIQLKQQGSITASQAAILAVPGAAGAALSILVTLQLDGATALTLIAIANASGAAAQYLAGIYGYRIQ